MVRWYLFGLLLLTGCNGGGGGGGSSSSNLSSLDCTPKTVGPTTPSQVCRSNEQAMTICSYSRDNCRRNCYSAYQSALRASGVTYSGPHMAILNQCYSGCDNSQLSCLRANGYGDGTDCGQAPVQVVDPRCFENTNNTTGTTSTGNTTSSGTTTVGTTGGSTTTGGATTSGTTTGSTTGGTTTGGTTTGTTIVGTTDGSTTTGGTTSGDTTGGTTTGGTTTGDTTGGGTTTGSTTYFSDPWSATVTSGAPTSRRSHTSVWTGSEMIIWGGAENYTYQGNLTSRNTNTGGRYNPSSNSWVNLPNSITFTPTTRDGHTAVWTGNEMIVWGGYQDSQQTSSGYVNAGATNTGAIYKSSDNSWNPTSITGGPIGRYFHTSIWTGTEMIVWGGRINSNSSTNLGSRYNPTTFTWTSLPNPNSSGAPSARSLHTAVWTGSEMIVWGGTEDGGSSSTNTGGRYNPSTDTWSPITIDGAPTARYGHTAIWTGSEMIVWGGNGKTGGRYSPATNTWTELSAVNAPVGKGHTAIWTGSEMVVWGGSEVINGVLSYSNTGAVYNPTTNEWVTLTLSGTPSGRTVHSAVWTGTEMIVWGGGNMATGTFVNSGAKIKR